MTTVADVEGLLNAAAHMADSVVQHRHGNPVQFLLIVIDSAGHIVIASDPEVDHGQLLSLAIQQVKDGDNLMAKTPGGTH